MNNVLDVNPERARGSNRQNKAQLASDTSTVALDVTGATAESTPRPIVTASGRRVLTHRETAVYLGLSESTLERLDRDGLGPRRVRLSTRRWGYPVQGIEEWLAARSATGV
jgi:predicted DNA-binding transcriptional regulator AlpA